MYTYKNKDGHIVKFIKPVSKKAQKILGFKNIRRKAIKQLMAGTPSACRVFACPNGTVKEAKAYNTSNKER